ncbi:MAG: Ig-like domain-containing protein [Gemmatimonadales bacterium]
MTGQGWRIRTLVGLTVLVAAAACGDAVEPDELVAVAIFSAGQGSGTVTITPSGTACTIVDGTAGNSCGAAVPVGVEVVLKATPAGGHSFTGWGDDCAATTTDSCTLRADAPLSVTVSFLPIANLPVDHLALDRGQVRLGLGQSTRLVARVFGPGGVELVGRVVTWSTDRPDVAHLVDGMVTPGVSGAAIVTAASGGKTASATIEVPARVMHDLAQVNGMPLPGVMELVRVPDNQGRLFDVRATATGGWLEIDTVTNWYRERVDVQVDVRLVATPERDFEFDSRSIWGDHGRILSEGVARGRFISEYWEHRADSFERTATGYAVTQQIDPAAIPAVFRFARR